VDTLLPVDAETPRSLVLDPPLTDAQFQELCFANDWFRFERTREGEILMHHRQGSTHGSNAGFFLPDGSMLNPDAAYVLPQKLKGLTKDDLTGLPYLCPDFIIELLSASDSLSKAQQKMERWVENGVALGWLIDPYKKTVYVYEPGRGVATVSGKTVQGSGSVEGFTLDLDELWRCYEI